MESICACFLWELHVIANNTLKQLIIPEYHMIVHHKGPGDSNVYGGTSIFVVGHDYVKKVVLGCFF